MIGTRCSPPEIMSLLCVWEYQEKRNALIDNISALRTCHGSCILGFCTQIVFFGGVDFGMCVRVHN